MKQIRHFLCLFLLAISFAAHAAAESVPAGYRSREKVTVGPFGTVSRFCVFDDFTDPEAGLRFEALWAEIKQILSRLDSLFSLTQPDSEIARFNALPEGGRLAISEETAQLLQRCHALYALTDGFFNPAVSPLVDLWGFSARFREGENGAMPYDRAWDEMLDGLPPPDPRYIDAFLQLTDFDGIVLSQEAGGRWVLVKETPSVTVDGVIYPAQIDLGGIVKGYAVDLVTERLQAAGVSWGFFSCGTSSISLLGNASAAAQAGNNADFDLAIRNPRPGEGTPEACLRVRAQYLALSTSGDYDENYFIAGQRACHIINPFTGYPLNMRPDSGAGSGLCSATLLSGSACDDDALTTALLLMGEERAAQLLARLGDRHALLIRYTDGLDAYDVLTDLPSARITLLDERYRLVPLKADERP